MPKRTLESNGGVPGVFVEMVFHPGTARKHAVSPKWSRRRSRTLLPTASGESDPRYGSKTQRVSFVNISSSSRLDGDMALTNRWLGPLADFEPVLRFGSLTRDFSVGVLSFVMFLKKYFSLLSRLPLSTVMPFTRNCFPFGFALM